MINGYYNVLDLWSYTDNAFILQPTTGISKGCGKEAVKGVPQGSVIGQVVVYICQPVWKILDVCLVTLMPFLLKKIILLRSSVDCHLQVQISELEAELARPEKANADELYMNKFYEHKVMQLAIKDLDKYGQVLEKALLEYHRNCMKSINRSLRQLWRTVYRGHDIDYIQIKAEDTGGSKNRRSYNYKVVQIKNGIEMDFRGR